jgi:predicted nucleic acid-binding protein
LSIYADTSLLVSLYGRDSHSAEALHRMESKPGVWLTPLHGAEFAHALAQHIFRRHLSLRESQRVFVDFDADTSLIVSLYVRDSHSAEALHRMGSKPGVWPTPVHRVEFAQAVERHIFRRQLSLRESQRVLADFDADRAAGVWAEVGFPDLAFEVCAQLARRHARRLGVRTLDTLHVACALELKATQFWTFDERQARPAQAEGLKIV